MMCDRGVFGSGFAVIVGVILLSALPMAGAQTTAGSRTTPSGQTKLNAQTVPDLFAHAVTAGNRDSLEKAIQRMSRYPVLRGRFEQTKEIGRLDRTIRSAGRFVISRDHGLVFDTETPFPSTTIIGEDFFLQQRDSGERSVIDAEDNPVFLQFSDTMRATFSGDVETLFERFEVFFREIDDRAYIGLIPRDQTVRSVISSMEIVGTDVIHEFVTTEPTGDSVRYIFSKTDSSDELFPDERALFEP